MERGWGEWGGRLGAEGELKQPFKTQKAVLCFQCVSYTIHRARLPLGADSMLLY